MKLKIGLGVLATVLVAVAVIYFINAPRSGNISYPSPNAYDTLSEANGKMTPLPMDFDTSQDVEALQTYLDANLDPLSLIDQAARQRCLIRMADMQTMQEMHDKANYARGPMRLLYVKARLAELEGRSADAADALAKIAVIGRKSAHGGLLIHQLVAVAIERQGLEGLAQLASKLSGDEKKRIAKLIRAEDKDAPEIDAVIESVMYREHDMTKREYGTFAGSFMIWQLSDSEAAEKPQEILRNELTEIQEQREELLTMLRVGP
ncbi:hypothetical protein [Planctomycetes bacterium TBK1r]|uniref:Uncharacterized protein n=1 Tax=Stieleria magnilauensis TaxID=2527963 RepID=A0ABX5Y2Y2_9BACT|nr:hypothetical protein TBK1r_76700 [Planctomycetes bacterium TBK1r]